MTGILLPPSLSARFADDQCSLLAQARKACRRAGELHRQGQAARDRAQALRNSAAALRDDAGQHACLASHKEPLQRSPYARLLARLESMPVIEQAKGILMAQSGCDEDKAFDLPRQASQRLNMPVRDLAAQITVSAAQPSPRGNPASSPAPVPSARGPEPGPPAAAPVGAGRLSGPPGVVGPFRG